MPLITYPWEQTNLRMTRISVLGNYLVSVSKSLVVDEQPGAAAPKAKRNRFDLLLIISDVLHTDTFHSRSTTPRGIFGQECVPSTTELLARTAACCNTKSSPIEQDLMALLNYWAVNQLLTVGAIKTCRDRVEESLLIAQGGTPVRKRNYFLPEYHGDRNAPWSELPAAYMLEPMIREPLRPIEPHRIKIAKLDNKPVTPHVRKLLDNFFDNIDLKYMPTGDNPTGEIKKYKLWLDPLGQTVKQEKKTGEVSVVCNGYGWSVKFCQDMQKHGVPQNIKTAREDLALLEEDAREFREVRQRQREGQRRSISPRRRRHSSSPSEPRQERSRDGRVYNSGYDRYNSRTPSRSPRDGRPESRQSFSSDERGRDHNDRRLDQSRQPPTPYGRDSSQSNSQRYRYGANTTTTPPPPGRHLGGFVPPSLPPQAPSTASHAQGYPQSFQPPFGAPHFPFPPPVPGTYGAQYAMPPFVPPPPPQQFQGSGSFVPPLPPPPPNYSGPFPPPLPIPTQQNAPFMNNPYANQHGNNHGYYNNAPYDTIATPEEAIMVVIGGIGVSVDSVEEESIEIKGKQELFDNGDDFRLDYIPVLQYMAER
ncbi:predicted protein [Plenodomus lingam JN3]|uniref:Predicted protein n=1 Tax=Leptosphaeria maculans (strain JN3 / isolate v23.1.3 / race Av1-4-5-6-7-8) TaxID=985895 RepID=E5A9F4_LEPMJ|nr:predicted protein [Plenodomus lingam JN3]CBY00295.1 predicted protein [Plenodomus lingam JN3]